MSSLGVIMYYVVGEGIRATQEIKTNNKVCYSFKRSKHPNPALIIGIVVLYNVHRLGIKYIKNRNGTWVGLVLHGATFKGV
jgi:hypothetical protein